MNRTLRDEVNGRYLGSLTTCNEDITKKICDHLMRGHYITTACESEGVSRHTYYEWMRKAKSAKEADKQTIHTFFSQSVEQARAKGEVVLLDRVIEGGKGQERYGRNQKIEVTRKVHHIIDAPPDTPQDYSKWLERYNGKAIQENYGGDDSPTTE